MSVLRVSLAAAVAAATLATAAAVSPTSTPASRPASELLSFELLGREAAAAPLARAATDQADPSPSSKLTQEIYLNVVAGDRTVTASAPTIVFDVDVETARRGGQLSAAVPLGAEVRNALGDGEAWTLVAKIDQPDGRLTVLPAARVAHQQVPGDVATITAGAPSTDAVVELCTAPQRRSGGTFRCAADVVWDVPAGTAPGRVEVPFELFFGDASSAPRTAPADPTLA